MSQINQPAGALRETYLEQLHGFRCPPLREYINYGRWNITKLLSVAEGMASHDHPVARYGAGWAMAGAALHREKHPIGTPAAITVRLRRLEDAQSLWADASAELEARARRPARDQLAPAGLFGLSLKAMEAMTYIPSMRLTAQLLERVPPEPAQEEEVLRATKRQALALGAAALGLTLPNRRWEIVRRDFGLQLLAGLHLQQYRPLRWLIQPASLGHQCRPDRNMQADLYAIAAVADRVPAKRLIRLEDKPQPPNSANLIIARNQLVLHGHQLQDTFEAFAARENGTLDDAHISAGLDQLSDTLARRLIAFTPPGAQPNILGPPTTE